ncbi:DNA/RNA polymerase, partial [Ramicandelaber brevisporus]
MDIPGVGKISPIRASQGLSIMPAIAQRYISSVLREHWNKHALAYIDDCVIGADSIEELIKITREVLDAFEEHNISISAEKARWFCQPHIAPVNAVGFTVSKHGIQPDVDRLQGLNDMADPTNM